jgi:hypothetical protein
MTVIKDRFISREEISKLLWGIMAPKNWTAKNEE